MLERCHGALAYVRRAKTMTLRWSRDDCCSGHECDRCVLCLRGRCCRVDDPDYALPKMGEWQPVHGALGVITATDTRIQCHACGAWYRTLTQHAWAAHDLTSREYRALFGLPASHSMTSPASSRKLRSASDRSPEVIEWRRAGMPPMLPEQRAQFAEKHRLKMRDLMRARRARQCTHPGCEQRQETGGLCRWHYRWRRTAVFDPTKP